MPSDATVSTYDVLVVARTILSDERHWTRGTLSSHGGTRHCMLGAIKQAGEALGIGVVPYYREPVVTGAIEAACAAVCGFRSEASALVVRSDYLRGIDAPTKVRFIVGFFNDHPSTAHDDVLQVLDLAIAAQAPARELVSA